MHLALNRADSDDLLAGAICVDLTLSEGDAPEWVHILPQGPEVQGRDGRRFRISNPLAVIEATQAAEELPAPIDYMHASEFRREDGTGVEAPAAGWIVELSAEAEGNERGRLPGIWGRVEWTPRGQRAVADREYRFFSPAFLFRRDTGEVVRITSGGLVHKPNLPISALNQRVRESEPEEEAMNEEEKKALCRKLGLPEDASTEAVMNRVTELDAAHKALNGRGEVVPKADYEVAVNRATQAEQRLKDQADRDFKARVDSTLDKHQKGRKFAPASREFYRSTCTGEEKLAEFEREMNARAPIIGEADNTSREAAAQNNRDGGRPVSLTVTEKALCAERGISEANFLAAKQEAWDDEHPEEG